MRRQADEATLGDGLAGVVQKQRGELRLGTRQVRSRRDPGDILDLGAWQLREARGISEVNAFGEFTVVGVGTNPSGESEGFVAVAGPVTAQGSIPNRSRLTFVWR